MKKELEEAVKFLAGKASTCGNSNDALKYTQATLNASHALVTVIQIDRDK